MRLDYFEHGIQLVVFSWLVVLVFSHPANSFDLVQLFGIGGCISFSKFIILVVFLFLPGSLDFANEEQLLGQVVSLGLIFRNVCVWMEPKDLRHLLNWHVVDLINVDLEAIGPLWEDEMRADVFVLAVGVVGLEHFLRQEVFEEGHEHALVGALRNSATVIALANQIIQSFKWNIVVSVNELVQLIH